MAAKFSRRGVGARSEVVSLLALLLILPSFTERERPIPSACEPVAVVVVPFPIATSIPGLKIGTPFGILHALGPPKLTLPKLPAIPPSTTPPNPPSGNRFT
jgi:hypothetical protein